MRVALRDGTRIFFEVIGTKLVADGPTMRERPTLLLLHGGPGFDHSGLATTLAPLSDVAQLVLLDHRGQGRSDGDDVGSGTSTTGFPTSPTSARRSGWNGR